jgi:hypothetical protein
MGVKWFKGTMEQTRTCTLTAHRTPESVALSAALSDSALSGAIHFSLFSGPLGGRPLWGNTLLSLRFRQPDARRHRTGVRCRSGTAPRRHAVPCADLREFAPAFFTG